MNGGSELERMCHFEWDLLEAIRFPFGGSRSERVADDKRIF